MTVPITEWAGAYDSGWRDVIVSDAFSHPAKMSRGLLERIVTHLFEIGAVTKGSLVLDPFGGIGTTGLIGAVRGLRVVGVELEPKFVALARQNIERHRQDWAAMGFPVPIVIQGDSRQLREVLAHYDVVEAVVSSPPYAETGQGSGNMKTGAFNPDKATARSHSTTMGPSCHGEGYGDTPGQLGTLSPGTVEAVVSSPPYAGSLTQGNTPEGYDYTRYGGGGQLASSQTYGDSEGQLERLSPGAVDAVIASPPYAEIASGAGGLNTQPPQHAGQQSGRSAGSASQDTDQRYGNRAGQMAKLPTGSVDAIVTSPPYEESVKGGMGACWTGDESRKPQGGQYDEHYATYPTMRLGKSAMQDYGETPGQLGAMAGGDGVEAIVTSPPYWKDRTHSENQDDIDPAVREKLSKADLADRRYGDSEGQLGEMPSGAVDAVVSSPPFTQGYSGGGGINQKGYGPDGADKVGSRTYQGTGAEREPGNLETLTLGAVEAVVSSPPYAASDLGGDGQRKFGGNKTPEENKATKEGKGLHGTYGQTDGQLGAYGETDGQLGAEQGETFWSAAQQVVRECYALLKPGGYAVWVVKAFVRDKKLVDFPGDWRRLCEHAGFITRDEIHALLVHEETRAGLFEDRVIRRERKSFFRRLAEKKGSPRIDFEVVYVMRKPL